jgi:hypothetical protein
VIEELKPHSQKVRVVLNKADEVEPQKLEELLSCIYYLVA